MSLQKRGRFLCFPSCFRGLRKCGDVTWRYRLSWDVAKGLYLYSLCDIPHHLSSHYTLGTVFHMTYTYIARQTSCFKRFAFAACSRQILRLDKHKNIKFPVIGLYRTLLIIRALLFHNTNHEQIHNILAASEIQRS